MVGVSVETGVDKLVTFLQKEGKISVKEAANKLNIPEETLQLWIDFLVEERIIGLEYKFTKPYIFFNKSKKKSNDDTKQNQITLQFFEDEYALQAKKNLVQDDKIPQLWLDNLESEIDKKKSFFLQETNKRSLKHPEHLFELYKKRILQKKVE